MQRNCFLAYVYHNIMPLYMSAVQSINEPTTEVQVVKALVEHALPECQCSKLYGTACKSFTCE